MQSVYPSGAARARLAPAPMLPPAPPTFSTTIAWPSGAPILSKMTRADKICRASSRVGNHDRDGTARIGLRHSEADTARQNCQPYRKLQQSPSANIHGLSSANVPGRCSPDLLAVIAVCVHCSCIDAGGLAPLLSISLPLTTLIRIDSERRLSHTRARPPTHSLIPPDGRIGESFARHMAGGAHSGAAAAIRTFVESPEGVSPPGAPRTVHDPRESHGSRCSAVAMA